MPDFSFEDRHGAHVAGVDEVGRGPWAGPIVAGAVVFERGAVCPKALALLKDSKKMTARARLKARDALFQEAEREHLWFCLGEASVEEIDALNIHQATLLAMARAVEGLARAPSYLLVDGLFVPKGSVPGQPLVKGDDKSLSIAAAAILAKVARDALMADLASAFPGYGWEKNAGYGTKAHQEGLALHGVTPHHRRSFAPIAKLISQDTSRAA
ncbi:MAG: ribonuclease HII [Proteobacteria bacterium]|nr:ribonuclease HII [Pseudomonadota bacterium]